MNKKALATALLTASLCVAVLVGCGSSNVQTGSDQQRDQVVSSEASSASAESVESGTREGQGDMVTAVVAARHPDVASALVLLYPALSIVDGMHDEFSSESDIPQTYELFGWMEAGRNYATDVWNYDVYGEIGKYMGPVLIEHGSEDSTVPISYSRRAAKAYAHATLDVLKGAGHGFTGDDFDMAVENMLDFLDEHVGN